MNALEQLALAWRSLLHTLRLTRRLSLLLPWIALLAVQLIGLAAFSAPASPLTVGWLWPLIARLAGEDVLHYPRYFRELPWIWGRADFVLGVLLSPLASGWSAAAFAAAFRGERRTTGEALGSALRRMGALFVILLPLSALSFAFSAGLGGWLAGQRHTILVRALGEIAMILGPLLAQAAFFFAPCFVVLGGYGALDGWREIPRSLSLVGVSAFASVALALAAVGAAQLAVGRASSALEREAPERVVLLLGATDAVAALFGFLLTGVAALIYLSVLEPDAEPSR